MSRLTRTGPAARPARRRLAGAALVTALMMSSQAMAAQRCANVTEQSLFEVEALKTELMVAAVACKQEDQYNAFVERYKPQLSEVDREFGRYFQRSHGRGGDRAYDDYITSLANGRSQFAHSIGSDYCIRNIQYFAEVNALPSGAELRDYAAGKDLIPENLGACGSASSAATPVRGRAAASPARSHRR